MIRRSIWVVLLAMLVPISLAAQGEGGNGNCADCENLIPGIMHIFTSVPLPEFTGHGTHHCDNAGGCHFTEYLPGCSVHNDCFETEEEEELLHAFSDTDALPMLEALKQTDQAWQFDGRSGTLTVYCGSHAVARFPYPEQVWGSLPTESEVQQ